MKNYAHIQIGNMCPVMKDTGSHKAEQIKDRVGLIQSQPLTEHNRLVRVKLTGWGLNRIVDNTILRP